jgi:WD40 repeat protein
VARSFPPGRPTALTCSPCGRLTAAGAAGGRLTVWDNAHGRQAASWDAHAARVTCAAFARGGALLLTASDDGTVRMWEPATGAALATVSAHGAGVHGFVVAAGAAGRARMLTVGGDRRCKAWDIDTMTCLLDVELSCIGTCVAVDAAWTYAFVGGRDGDVFRIDLGDVDEHGSGAISTLAGHDGPVLSVAVSADGMTLFSGGEDGTVRVWDAGSCQHLRTLTNHSGPVSCVATIIMDASLLDREERDADKGLWQPAPLQKFPTSA